MKIYKVEKKKVKNMLEAIMSRISITTDMWAASNQKKGYMAVTAHYLDDSWTLQKRIISFCYVLAPHTAEVVTEHLMDTLLTWNIDQKLATLTVDNAKYNDNVATSVVERIGESNFMIYGALFHMRCCAHVLNLIVQDGLTVIKNAIEKVRDSVVFWTATPKRVEFFEEIGRALKVSVSKSLELDCPTRWNPTYMMFDTALRYRSLFFRLKIKEPKYVCCPNEEEWDLVKEVCGKLKIFYDVTKLFSGINYPTTNLYFTNVCQIMLTLSEWKHSGDELIKAMAIKMEEKFKKYWDVAHGLLGVAVILDPRYKLELLDFYFEKIYGDKCDEELERVKSIMNQLLQEYQDKFEREKQHSNLDSTSSSVVSTCVDTSNDNLAQFDQFISRKRKRKTVFRSELDNYLEDDVLRRDPKFDILAWWKTNGLKYPVLQMIARDVLVLPVSTVASESTFSTGGRLLNPHRNRLLPSTVKALACAQNWLLVDFN